MPLKTKSLVCAVLAILIVSVGLTSCASVSKVPTALPALYQPPVLRLTAGTELQTKDGPYRAPADEVWQSDARYRQLEQENLNLTAALAQLRARQ